MGDERVTPGTGPARVTFPTGAAVSTPGPVQLGYWQGPVGGRPDGTEEDKAVSAFCGAMATLGCTVREVFRLELQGSLDPTEAIVDLPPLRSADSRLVVVPERARLAVVAPAHDSEAGLRFSTPLDSGAGLVKWLVVVEYPKEVSAHPSFGQVLSEADAAFRFAMHPASGPVQTLSRRRFCPNCGGALEEGSRFCPTCGAAQSPIDATTATVASPPPSAAVPRYTNAQPAKPMAATPTSPAPTRASPPPTRSARFPLPSMPSAPSTARPVRGTASAKAPAAEAARTPHIDFPDSVAARESHPLVVRLTEPATPKDLLQSIKILFKAGQAKVKLNVSISAPGFEVEPARELSMEVGRRFNPKAERVTFTLTAQDPGDHVVERDIRVDFWSGNASLGGVTHWLTVRPTTYTGPSAPARRREIPFELRTTGRDCELVIRVEGKEETGAPPYRMTLRSRIPGEPEYESRPVGTMSFSRKEFSDRIRAQFAAFASSFPAAGTSAALARWRSDLLEEIDVLGRSLWTMLPDPLRAEYLRLHAARHLPTSILVHSDEMLIPWELIVPHDGGKSLPRLGVAHVMGRWRPALGMRPRPQDLPVKTATIANPKYDSDDALIWSVLEAADLRQTIPAFQAMPAVDRASMTTLLKRTDIQLLHFTGHGEYAKHADLSRLLLERNDSLTAMHFVGSPLLNVGHPIVYLNACEVGTAGVSLGQMGGFVAACVENGCSGVVAPYWAVADDSAREFAVAFYGKLKAGRSIGEALQDLRKAKPKDPTYQAFAYLGDPWTRPVFQTAGERREGVEQVT